MPERLIPLYEVMGRLFPFVIGIGVNMFDFKLAFFRIVVTCVSMLLGALFVHYLKPVIVRCIDNLKKKPKK